MSSSSDSWGGDYSFLLQSIEGKISENIMNKSPVATRPLDASDSSSKRRWSDFQSPMDNMPMSSAKKLKSFAEIDDLHIQNEQLRDSIARLESERQIAKDEHVRQLKFMDERCSSLKKESSERLEKYYDEKKKWQSKHRELELQLKKATDKPTASTPAPSVPTPNTDRRNDEVFQRLRTLEAELSLKVSESRENLKGKLAAETKLFETETELRTLQSSMGAGGMADEAREEARTLRKQYGDLESVHKRTAREHEAMKGKLKNQSLLEEEVSTLKARLRLAEEKLNTFKQKQIDHQQLLEEKSLWTQLFQEIVAQPEHHELLDDIGRTGATAVSPTLVLQLLSAYQSKCAVLLQGQGQLQHSVSELRRHAREAHAQHETSLTALQSTQARLETVEVQLRTALQQARLFDGEIRSLRSLLETYDLEFRIGKPDAVKVMALKDRLAEELRAELDQARQSALALSAQVRALESASEARTTELFAAQAEVAALREAAAASALASSDATAAAAPVQDQEAMQALQSQVSAAQHDLLYLQHVTGLDYLPDRTQVLHMALNPTSGAPEVRTVPSVTELRRLRMEHQHELSAAQLVNAQLHEAMEAAVAEAATAASSDTRSTTSSTALTVTDLAGPSAAPLPAVPAAQVATDSVMNIRLKEQFKERIAAFREGVYLLMGYKVDMYAADGSLNSLPRLRLRSMYAEKPEDYLLFQMRGDCPELLDTEFASRLDPGTLRYLTTCNSVPAFVSAVTLDLFERQTFQG